MNGFSVYYVEANIVCVLVFGILLIHNHFNIDRQEKQIKYDHVLNICQIASGFFVMTRRRFAGLPAASQEPTTQSWRK